MIVELYITVRGVSSASSCVEPRKILQKGKKKNQEKNTYFNY